MILIDDFAKSTEKFKRNKIFLDFCKFAFGFMFSDDLLKLLFFL